MRRVGVAAALVFAAAAPASASAAVRYASPTGSGTACTSSSPCGLETAVETVAQPGDEVVVRPGTYSLGGDVAQITDSIHVHGVAGAARPLIQGTSLSVLEIFDPDARLEDVMVRNLNGDALYAAVGTVDRVVAHGGGTNGVGCFGGLNPPATGPATIRNSLCLATGVGGRGLSTNINAGGNDYVGPTLLNSTVIATGMGAIGIRISCSSDVAGASCTMATHNTIVSGVEDDLEVEGDANTAVSVNLQSSNYDDPNLGTNASVTPPGTARNQIAPPLLAGPASGNVSQLSGSPTIDAGVVDPLPGSLDLDRQPRAQGAAPDIGADEFVSVRCRGAAPTMVAGAGVTTGTPGRDVILGSSGRNVIRGLGGGDLICSLRGRDVVRAGGGRDRLFGGGGRDRLFGGGGRDLLKGQGGRDLLKGQGGPDLLVGGGRRDSCVGGPGRDRSRRC